MASLQGQTTTFNTPEKSKQFSLGALIGKYLFHWPLFLLCLGILIPLAYIYVGTLSPVYEVKASLLIKDDKKNQDRQVSALHEIDFVNSAKTIENEIEILKSRKLTNQVVQDLKLWVNYQQKEGLKKIDLYNLTPVKINFLKQNPNFEGKTLQIIPIDGQSFDFIMPNGKSNRFQFNKAYKNSLGIWTIEPTKHLADHIGDKLSIAVSNPETVVVLYQKAIDASLSNKLSSTIVVSLNDANAQRGKDILNQLLVNYNLSSSTDKNKDVKNTINFLDQKITELSGDLGASEKGIEDYKSSKGLTDISLQSKVSLENLQANDTKLNDANIQLDIINRIDKYVNSSKNSEKVPSANGIDDPSLSNLIDNLSKLQLDYQELAATTPETSPEFEPINRQIKTTKQTIKETVRSIKVSLQGKRDKLSSYNSNFESSIRSIPTQEREFINIKRQQSSKEGLYTYYLQKREEASANYAATLTDDKIIDQAYASFPKDKKNTIYALALVLGLGLPSGLIFIRSLLSNKVIGVQDITEAVDLPVIAEIPLAHQKNQIAINERDATPTSEQFRALRTRLHYLHKEKTKGRVTLITSSLPGEGKSFVSINLSISLAYTERKTIILELDMRKPKILGILNLPNNKPGLNEYFMRSASINDIIQKSGVTNNLDVISSGEAALNPSELLERPELFALIEALSEIYDDIIIDSPPVHLVPDATIVSPLTDVCLYVIRQGVTSKTELNYLETIKDQNQLKNINIVFNGLDRQKFGSGYSYSNSYYTTTKKNFLAPVFSDFGSRF